MRVRLAAIVEGHGETEAVPLLVRRIAARIDPSLVVVVDPVLRVAASSLLRPGELERQVVFAGRKVAPAGGILVLLDCDADGSCPAVDGPQLLQRVRAARGDLATSVVLAKKEFEAWFLAAAVSLRGHRRLAPDMAPPPNAEEIRGAKEWLSRHMPPNRPYAPTIDQPALTQIFDLDAARLAADSFDKCYREIAKLIRSQVSHG
jgi:uncharacterized protein DUF4276